MDRHCLTYGPTGPHTPHPRSPAVGALSARVRLLIATAFDRPPGMLARVFPPPVVGSAFSSDLRFFNQYERQVLKHHPIEEFYRQLEGVVIDTAEHFNDKLAE